MPPRFATILRRLRQDLAVGICPRAITDACEADTLLEAKVLIERWRVGYNTQRPHSSLGYRPPAPEAIVPWTPGFGATLLRPASMAGAVEALT
jgi:hypothetical protein